MNYELQQFDSFLPLVRKIAWSYARKFRGELLFDDLFQEGCIGLIDALARVDHNRPTARTFITMRVSGAIKDHIRNYLPTAGRDSFVQMWPLADAFDQSIQGSERDIEKVADLCIMLQALPGRLRSVIEWELAGKKQSDLASEIGCHPSRISQLRSEAIDLMRKVA